MSKARFFVNLLALVVLTLGISSIANAQATRTWVSGVGDDANPCSRTAPCKTFAGAISKTAAKGEISVLDPGGFGALTVTKSITLNGDGTLAGILSANVSGIIINAGATGRLKLDAFPFLVLNDDTKIVRLPIAFSLKPFLVHRYHGANDDEQQNRPQG